MDAMVRRVLAIAGLEPRAGRAPLDPLSFGDERQICQAAKDRLEGLLRVRRALHSCVAARRPGDGSSALMSVALNRLADEVANMACTTPSMIKLAEAERATGVLDGSAGITSVLDAYASDPTSIDDLVAMLVVAMGVGQRT